MLSLSNNSGPQKSTSYWLVSVRVYPYGHMVDELEAAN